MMGMLVLQGEDRNAQQFAQVPQVQIGPATGPTDQQPAPVAPPTTRGTLMPEEPDSTAPPAPTPGQMQAPDATPKPAPGAAPATAPVTVPATAPTTQP
jgi:hypothetical protein